MFEEAEAAAVAKAVAAMVELQLLLIIIIRGVRISIEYSHFKHTIDLNFRVIEWVMLQEFALPSLGLEGVVGIRVGAEGPHIPPTPTAADDDILGFHIPELIPLSDD